MGKTVPSFTIAPEIERTKWKQFRSLLDKKDRKMFDEMFDYVKLHNTDSISFYVRVAATTWIIL
jgi:hypothetical protein